MMIRVCIVHFVLLMLFSFNSINAQSILGISSSIQISGLQETKIWEYSNVGLDSQGKPVLARNAHEYSEIKLMNGLIKKLTVYDFEEKKNRELIYYYKGENLSKVEVSSFRNEKARLSKWHENFYKDGKISYENVYDADNELLGVMNYDHKVDKEGNRIVEMLVYKSDESQPQAGSSFIYNSEDLLINKVIYVNQDTIDIYNVMKSLGDSIIVASQVIKQREQTTNKQIDVETTVTTKTRKDQFGAPIFLESKVEGFDISQGKDVSKTKVTVYENHYQDGTITGGLKSYKLSQLSGSFYDERENVMLNISEEGDCTISQFKDVEGNGVKAEMMVSESSWSYLIIDQKTCQYDPINSTITFGGNIKEEITLKVKNKKVVLIRPSSSSYMTWDKVYLTIK